MRTVQLITLLSLIAPALAATSLKVDVYEGPTECSDEDKVHSGDHLEIRYTGTIDESSETGEKGSKFDSSVDRDDTFEFQIGQGAVIKGWDEGFIGLCKRAKATLVIPPEMGYGSVGEGATIPGGATLNFSVEVVNINMDHFDVVDLNGDGFHDNNEVEAYFKKMGHPVPRGVWHKDRDRDRKLSREELQLPQKKRPSSAKEDL